MRRMGRYNLSGVLAADQRQDRRSLRTPPTRRPREDIFLPEQNRYLLACTWVPPRRLTPPQERRCPCASGTRYHRPTCGAEPRLDAERPRRWLDGSRAAEPPACPTRSATTISCCGSAVIGRPRRASCAAGHRHIWTPRRHSRPRRTGSASASGRHARRPPGMDEALRLVDRGTVGQRNDCADPWGGH